MTSVSEVVMAALALHQVELEDIRQVKAGSRVVLRITVDGDGAAGRGLTLDEVADASHSVSQALDESGVMGDKAYVLEVGTRGVGAPLTKPAHWRRNIGRLVEVTVGGQTVTDRIVGADSTTVSLSGRTVPLAEITRAVVQVEMNRDDELED